MIRQTFAVILSLLGVNATAKPKQERIELPEHGNFFYADFSSF